MSLHRDHGGQSPALGAAVPGGVRGDCSGLLGSMIGDICRPRSAACRRTPRQRPATPAAYPAVHDMPPARNTAPLDQRAAEAARGRPGGGRATASGGNPDAAAQPPGTTADPQSWRRPQPVIKGVAAPPARRTGSPAEEPFRWKNFTASAACRLTCSSRSIAPRRRPATAGADIIDLGMGNPDLPAPAHVVEKLKETLGKPRTDRYSVVPGHSGPAPRAGRLLRAPLRREAQSRHPDRRHARLQGRLRQRRAGDHRAGRRRAGAQPELSDPRLRLPDGGRRDPLGAVGADAGVLRDRSSAPSSTRSRSRSRSWSAIRPTRRRMWPISTSTRSWSPFAKKHGIFILSDLAYAEVYFDDNPPPSVLQVPGAMDVAVEFTSMSKTYSMPGWRMGFAVGNERIIAALARVKSYLDYGAFTPIQVAATAALNGPDDCIHEMRDDLQAPPRRAGRELRPRRLGGAGAARLDVRLGADPGAVPARSAASNSPSCWSRRPRSRCRRASASASMARASCASRWSRTSSASARRRATSAASLKRAPEKLHNVVPLANAADRNAFLPDCLMAEPLRVGLAGSGTVGSAVASMLARSRAALAERCGRPIEVVAVCRRGSAARTRGSICRKVRKVADPAGARARSAASTSSSN